MRYSVEANKELFQKWSLLSAKIKCNGAIVQNNIKVSVDQVKEFKKYVAEAHIELDNLAKETLAHVTKGLQE